MNCTLRGSTNTIGGGGGGPAAASGVANGAEADDEAGPRARSAWRFGAVPAALGANCVSGAGASQCNVPFDWDGGGGGGLKPRAAGAGARVAAAGGGGGGSCKLAGCGGFQLAGGGFTRPCGPVPELAASEAEAGGGGLTPAGASAADAEAVADLLARAACGGGLK